MSKVLFKKDIELSFVIPAYDEVGNIEKLCERIKKTCFNLNIDNFEIIIVENGSIDGTADVIEKEAQADCRVKMVQLSRNFGYQGGITAGFNYCSGEWVAVLDADQQDPPEFVANMLTLAKSEGFDVVYGCRKHRNASLYQKTMYSLFYRIWSYTSSIKIPLDAGEFCVMNKRVVAEINKLTEKQRFTRGLRAWVGFRQTGLDYKRDEREGGTTKFNLVSSINLALDGILSYTNYPIRFLTVVGSIIMIPALLIMIVNILSYFIDILGFGKTLWRLPDGLTQLTALVVLFFGFTLVSLGVIGEYVGRIYEEVKSRPSFVVKSTLNF